MSCWQRSCLTEKRIAARRCISLIPAPPGARKRFFGRCGRWRKNAASVWKIRIRRMPTMPAVAGAVTSFRRTRPCMTILWKSALPRADSPISPTASTAGIRFRRRARRPTTFLTSCSESGASSAHRPPSAGAGTIAGGLSCSCAVGRYPQ
ncbi:hypothetical protein SDC9_196920 [bioreactor metagenome]|uniref:Uncharacterized protein n=1 Tax=bioreactor metagenome TaxID=1076179 RepID=A0A645IPY2_9ZZZZ